MIKLVILIYNKDKKKKSLKIQLKIHKNSNEINGHRGLNYIYIWDGYNNLCN